MLAVGLAALAAGACGRAADPPALAEVKRDELVVGVEVTGVLEAVDSTDVNAPTLTGVWSFKIAQLVPEGQEVKPGDPVIGFDPSEQVRALENMQNEAAAAQTKLAKRRDDALLAERDDELKIAEAEGALRKATLKADAPLDLVASVQQREVQLDQQAATLALDAARQHAEQARRSDAEEVQRLAGKASYARQRVAELHQTVAGLQVTAPRAGTVVYPANQQGDKPKIGDTAWWAEKVVQIVGLGHMLGNGQVDEVDMARLAEHQRVVLRLDAMPDVQLRGEVVAIARSVVARSRTDPSRVVKLRIAIDPSAVPLRPGMRFRGEVETEHLRDVVQVPADAVFATPDGPVVYRRAGGGFERVRLGLGRRTATTLEVTAGLAPGDRVSRTDPGAAPGGAL